MTVKPLVEECLPQGGQYALWVYSGIVAWWALGLLLRLILFGYRTDGVGMPVVTKYVEGWQLRMVDDMPVVFVGSRQIDTAPVTMTPYEDYDVGVVTRL